MLRSLNMRNMEQNNGPELLARDRILHSQKLVGVTEVTLELKPAYDLSLTCNLLEKE